MKLLFLLAFCAASTLAVPFGQLKAISAADYRAQLNRLDTRIIGGSPVDLGERPWQVGLYLTKNEGYYFCGGSLLSDEWVLTAGHCVYQVYEFLVIMGDVSLGEIAPTVALDVTTTAYLHPDYYMQYLNNDIGLVRLSAPVELNENIQPIALPSAGDIVGPGVVVTVSGWGITADDEIYLSEVLNAVDLTTISNEECADVFGENVVISSTLCAVGDSNQSTCDGDAGGPLTVDVDGVPTLAGVVSFIAAGGCSLGYPSGYVRTESFLEWISSTTGI